MAAVHGNKMLECALTSGAALLELELLVPDKAFRAFLRSDAWPKSEGTAKQYMKLSRNRELFGSTIGEMSINESLGILHAHLRTKKAIVSRQAPELAYRAQNKQNLVEAARDMGVDVGSAVALHATWSAEDMAAWAGVYAAEEPTAEATDEDYSEVVIRLRFGGVLLDADTEARIVADVVEAVLSLPYADRLGSITPIS